MHNRYNSSSKKKLSLKKNYNLNTEYYTDIEKVFNQWYDTFNAMFKILLSKLKSEIDS